jgi:hypothetical protein
MYDIERTIDATVEPVTLAQAKNHARVETDVDDSLIGMLIKAARVYCEKVTGRAFLQQTWRLSLDRFPTRGWHHLGVADEHRYGSAAHSIWRSHEILLPRPKLIGIVSITYLDLTGTRQTLDPSQYQTNFDAEPACVLPALNTYWPYAIGQRGSVQITYTAGYGTTAAAVPATLQLAILQLVAHWYENRESTVLPDSGTGIVGVPMSLSELLDSETITEFTYEA